MIELNYEELLAIDGGLQWVKLGLTIAAGAALCFCPPVVGLIGLGLLVSSDLVSGGFN